MYGTKVHIQYSLILVETKKAFNDTTFNFSNTENKRKKNKHLISENKNWCTLFLNNFMFKVLILKDKYNFKYWNI